MFPSHRIGRRAALGGLLGAAALSCTGVRAQPTAEPQLQPRIDVHAHYLPASYRQAAAAAGHERPDGMPGLPRWDTGSALGMMDGLNIRTAMLSISSPGVHFGDDAAARKLAQEVNEEGAKAVSDHPGRFGLFASLPLPDIDGALAEADRQFSTLMMAYWTNFAHRGDPNGVGLPLWPVHKGVGFPVMQLRANSQAGPDSDAGRFLFIASYRRHGRLPEAWRTLGAGHREHYTHFGCRYDDR